MKKQTQIIEQNDLDLSKYDWESLLAYREKLNVDKEQAEAGLKVINDELLIKLKEEKVNGKVVGDWTVTKAKPRFSLPIPSKEKNEAFEKLRSFGCIISKEVIDMDIVESLYYKKIELPYPVKIIEYVLVREVNKNE